jgi:predicted ATPase
VQILVDALKPKKLLLVLDNCEHLLSACAQVADALLRGCPNVQILATSREGLNITGEQTYRVPSLTLPDPRKLPPSERLQEFEAVRLFTDRAALGLPSFILTPANAATVAQVCRRLDGIPLAIELAAARVKALPVEKIAERLDDRFRLLTGGSRTALPRQQTLRALIDWSYDLLSESERSLLRRLSVFTGGWTSEAAEAVCAGEGMEGWEVLDRLTALVEKSLVVYEEHSGEPRYRLLETVRLYSRDRLLEVEGSGEGRGRHRDYFLRLAEATEPHLPGPNPAPWLDRLEKEHDNLRAALAWSLEREEGAEGLRLAGALARFWDMRGHPAEGRGWLAGTLSLAAAREPDAIRAKALFGAGLLAYRLGDFPAARVFWAESLAIRRHLGDQRGAAEVLDARPDLASTWEQHEPATWALLEENLAAWRELGDPQGIAGALTHMGVGSAARGEEAARSLYEEALALYRELGNRRREADILDELGLLAFKQGDCSSARALHEQSLKIRRELGDRWGIGGYFLGWVAFHNGEYGTAQSLWEEQLVIDRERMNQGGWVLIGLGRLAAAQGEYGAARARYEEFVTQNRRAGHEWSLALGLRALGDLACLEGQPTTAEALYEQSLILARELQDQRDIAWCLVGLADVRRAQEQSEQAARLLGAAEALWEAAGSSRWRPDHADFDRHAAAVRAQVDTEAFAAAWAEGQAMSPHEAVAFALEDDVSSERANERETDIRSQ